jgi:REP element-mobilizing transposase RayT
MYDLDRIKKYQNAPLWHSRGYLPHFDFAGATQFVTYRLADSLPNVKLRELDSRTASLSKAARLDEYEAMLDEGHGTCVLRIDQAGEIIEENFLRFDGERYRLLAWCVMPNHVHVVIQLLGSWLLSKVVQNWKAYSSKAINELTGSLGRLWQPEYFDRLIRDEEHLGRTIEYVERNPVAAGLCREPAEYRYSSAGRR